MKKCLALIALFGFLFSSCEKAHVSEIENPEQNLTPSTYVFTINAGVDEELTKTAYAGDATFSWSDGDQISVLFNDGAGNNKYYTLTAASGGTNTATFTGTIDSGWSIGASDTGKKWALFPADANHGYDTAKSMPIFSIPAETDFTAPGAHFSANVPLIAELPSDDTTNSFTFYSGTTVFKFTFINVDASKVKLILTNTIDRMLSGTTAVNLDGSRNYLSYSSSESVGSTSVSYTVNVESKTAVFYVPFRAYNTEFKPRIRLVNMDDGAYKNYIIFEATAKSALGGSYSWNKMEVIPPVSASGTGSPFVFSSKFGIDWSDGSIPSGTESDSGDKYRGIRVFKATADASYLYFYFEVTKSKLIINSTYKDANSFNVYFGRDLDVDGDWKWEPTRTSIDKFVTWLLRYGDPKNNSDMNACFWGDYLYVEHRYPRNKTGLEFLQTDPTAYVGMVSKYGRWHDGSTEQKIHSDYMFAPKTSEGYLEVSLPTYVAP